MKRYPWVVTGFVTFALLEIMSILSAVLMGRMANYELQQMLLMSFAITIAMGLFGIPLMLLFSKIHQYIPLESLTLKAALYFVALTFIFAALKAGGIQLNIDLLLSVVFSFVAAFISVQTFKFITKTT